MIRTALAWEVEFLRFAKVDGIQDKTFKLRGLVWAGAQPAEISRLAKRLLGLQHEGGCWSQLPKLRADAYTTGEALYALRASVRLPATPEVRLPEFPGLVHPVGRDILDRNRTSV